MAAVIQITNAVQRMALRRPGLLSSALTLWIAFSLCVQLAAPAAAQSQAVPVPPARAVGMEEQLAQNPSPASDASDGLIKLDVVVTDKSGKPVSGLTLSDFSLLDNGKPSSILSLKAFGGASASPGPPVKIVLLVDTLDLPDKLATYEQQEVERFLRQNGGKLAQAVSIFGLSNGGLWTLARASGDGNVLAEEIAHNKQTVLMNRTFGSSQAAQSLPSLAFEDPAGLTALEALATIATVERQRPGRKLLIWVGPGWGTGTGKLFASSLDRQRLFLEIPWFSTLMREARIALYSFSVGETDPRTVLYRSYLNGVQSDQQANIGDLDRKVLAVQSGGRVLARSQDPGSSIRDPRTGAMDTGSTDSKSDLDLVSQINGCVDEAATFYTLSFDPTPAKHPDEYHDLTVQVGKPGLTARTNTGYYDQPHYLDQPNLAARPVTVEQLDGMLAAAHGESDGEIARQLSDLQLTERLSSTKLSSLKAGLRGTKAQRALVALADASTFLKLPANEIPSIAAPDQVTQRRMILLAISYLNKTIPKLPNFFATRTTVSYVETPQQDEEPGSTKNDYQPLHISDSSRATVLYRNGNEVVDSGAAKPRKAKGDSRYLTTQGTFGPILGTVILDAGAPRSSVTWGYWEQGAGGIEAVFRYVIPEANSHYQVEFCCLPDGDGTKVFEKLTGYHGEIAIDPASGAILRLAMVADLKPAMPLVRSDTMVEYGPVEIGGNTYTCPLRSVSISRGRTVMALMGWDRSFRTFGPYATTLNDVDFGEYHMFRVESHALAGYQPASDDRPDSAQAPASAAPGPQ